MMNKIIKHIIVIFAISSFAKVSLSQNLILNQISIDSIMKVPFQNYIGKETFNLLLDDKIRKYQDFTFFDVKPGLLNGIIITINKSIYIEVYVYKYKFLKQFNEERIWDKTLFYRESISKIKVFNNNQCVLETKI